MKGLHACFGYVKEKGLPEFQQALNIVFQNGQ